MFSLHCIHSISFFDKIIHNEVVFISHIKIPRISQQMQIFQIAATILFYAWIWIAWKLSLTSNAYAFRNIFTYVSYIPILRGKVFKYRKNLQSSFRYIPLNFQWQFYLNSFKLLLAKEKELNLLSFDLSETK